MAAVNSIINKADYNDIRNKLVNVLGTGSADSGWGQTANIRSSAVSESTKVSATDWDNLRLDIYNSYAHVFGSFPTLAQVQEGYTIRYSNTFVPDTGPSPSFPSRTDAPITQFDTWVNSVVASKFSVASTVATAAVSKSQTWSNLTSPSSWSSRITAEVSVTFSSSDQARFFFNGGGKVRISATREEAPSPATPLGTSQASRWTTLLNSAGQRDFGGNSPTAGLGSMNGQNWYRLTSSDQPWYSLSDSSPYGGNQYRINAKANVSDNSTGTANIGYFLVEFIDGYTDPGGPPPYDNVDGKFTVYVSLVYPVLTFTPSGNSWNLTLPTVSIGDFVRLG